ncbi:saccharopine dehydrogenase family protein [Bdellovibrionota bacterium]
MKYAVLGAGMQGVAGAYDLAKFGDAEVVYLSDLTIELPTKGAEKCNKLLGKDIVKPLALNSSDKAALVKHLKDVDAVMCALPFNLNPIVAEAAIEAKTHFNDLGGDTPTAQKIHSFDSKAKKAGISLIPDCGVMPGMGNHFAAHAIGLLDKTDDVQVRCGGLPQNPQPPLGYQLVFSINGLLNNYFGKAWVLENGKVKEVDTFDEYEELELPPPVGKSEAITTTGATSTCPWTYEGKVDTWKYKTVRYKGHFEKIRVLRDLGFLDIKPVSVNGDKIAPRDLALTLLPPKIDFPNEPDLIVLRTTVTGTKDGKRTRYTYDLMDLEDTEKGFSAMARTTAFSAAVITIMQAKGEIPAGSQRLEVAVDQEKYIQELIKRGIDVKQNVETLS